MAMTPAQIAATLTAPGSPFEMMEFELDGIRRRGWKSGPGSIAELVQGSLAHGDRTYIAYQGDSLTYREHYQRVAALAAVLIEQFEVCKGERVAIAMRNLPEWSIAFWAITAIGAVAVPLNGWWTSQELCYGLVDSGSVVLIADGERQQRAANRLQELPGLRGILVTQPVTAPEGLCNSLDAVFDDIADDISLPTVDIQPDDPATIFYTSGSTGKPKGALGTHRNFCSALPTATYVGAWKALRAGIDLTQMAEAMAAMQARPRASLLTVPLFHVTGCIGTLLLNLAHAGKIVMMHKWDPQESLRLIEKEHITSFLGVPTMVWHLLDSPEREHYDLSSLESLSFGGAPAPAELRRRLGDTFPNLADVSTGYGLTECSSTVTFNGGADYVQRPDSVGMAPPVIDLKVIDDTGKVLEPGELGEICIKGPNVVRGYWNNPQATATSFVDGWFHTGDIGRIDDEGFVYLVDRKKDMIIRGGENIYCAEVEAMLVTVPGIRAASVFGVPHPTLGEEVGAVLQVDSGQAPDDDTLRAMMKDNLAAYKIPTVFWRQADALPLGATGKVDKRVIRASVLAAG
ncbi:long-chain fatty acid--CoA ligase [Parahaliea maris]|uniref:Long-chain fatty acid--CoA ligase n=1 Tax=Parahaliea maris TaxID=2716870 RepID=A0A5C9A639_9GAMM|nr:AMP-binding protein [Parahaliea maris]TXS96166.1 long-chain fatty acid--CoA ligase [Parahaliea maris]